MKHCGSEHAVVLVMFQAAFGGSVLGHMACVRHVWCAWSQGCHEVVRWDGAWIALSQPPWIHCACVFQSVVGSVFYCLLYSTIDQFLRTPSPRRNYVSPFEAVIHSSECRSYPRLLT